MYLCKINFEQCAKKAKKTNYSLDGNSVEEPLFTSPVKKALWKGKCKTYLFMVNGA